MRPVVVMSRSGCVLPLCIFLNTFFGWMFLKPLHWLGLELLLILLSTLNVYRQVKNVAASHPRRGNSIDVEGKVVD
jgi:hypothetical protein